MLLPHFLPSSLSHYAEVENEAKLFEFLSQTTLDSVIFFEYACADETWTEQHTPFMRVMLEWLTALFLEERLSMDSALRIARSIHAHYPSLQSLIPHNITFRIQGYDVAVNSLLIAVSSEYFHNLIRIECHDKQKKIVNCDEISYDMFTLVNEFANSGDIKNLWKRDQSFLFNFLQTASRLSILKLIPLCEETLKRYITRENALDILIEAHNSSWTILKQKCFYVLNQLSLGIRFLEIAKESDHIGRKELKPFAMEFLDFRNTALDIFTRVCSLVTHLICSGSLTEDASFSYVVQSCPHLIALDISRSNFFSERLLNIPSRLEQLDLSTCPWLTPENLKRIIANCPHLTRLSCSSNVQLTFLAWSELQKLKNLVALDISRCRQIQDEEFSLILKACVNASELNLEDCTKLTDKAFFELARSQPKLEILNVSRCHIGDGTLADITSRCSNLRSLNMSRCGEITNRGLLQAMRFALELRELYIQHCNIKPETVAAIKTMRPLLHIVH